MQKVLLMSSIKIKSSLFVCALLLLFGNREILAQGQSNEAQRILARAVQMHQTGDYEGAIREYKNFLIIYPNVLEVRSNLGAVYARLGRYQEALEEYKQALKLDKSNNPSLRFNLALGYYKLGMFNEAAEEFMKVVAADATNKNAALLVGDSYLNSGEFKKAIDFLTPLEAKFGDDRTFSYLLGSALMNDRQIEKGQILIDRILREGDSAEARLMMGVGRLRVRDFPGALEELQKALALNPKLPLAYSFYGQALLGSGNREGALKAFQTELESNPNDWESNLYMGILLKDDQKFEEALKYFQKALSLRPRELNVGYFIANINISLGKIPEAQKLLEEVVKEAPSFVEAHVLLATVYYRLKRKEDGDRERAIIQKLNAENQAKAPGAKENLGPAYRGEQIPETQPVKKPENPKP
jgi:tetratricopeptide (TPR) repeat protein